MVDPSAGRIDHHGSAGLGRVAEAGDTDSESNPGYSTWSRSDGRRGQENRKIPADDTIAAPGDPTRPRNPNGTTAVPLRATTGTAGPVFHRRPESGEPSAPS
jgi:hypothetical protein